jgi:Holliday junction resolvasome RuvABC endonuclease subunit
MLFLGIDTGTSWNLGVAVVDRYGDLRTWELLTPPRGKMPMEVKAIYAKELLSGWLRGGSPHDVALAGIERPWISKDKPMVGLRLALAGGAMLATLHEFGIHARLFAPSQAKSALTGTGNARKEAMLRFAQNMDPDIKNLDVADAIGVALAARAKWLEEHAGEN